MGNCSIGACGIPCLVCQSCCTCGKSISCTILGDTYGVAYRAITGKVDKYTKNNLVSQEQAQLVKAGMCANQALSTAQSDTSKTLKLNKACPCCCAANIPTWAYYALAVLVIGALFFIFAKEAARSMFE